MTRFATTYLVISGATTARRAPALAATLAESAPGLIVLLTPNAQRVIRSRELTLVPGVRVVESYFDDAILPRPPDGVVLFAPCSFNSLNKLAGGIADSLALSVVSEAIGRGTPIIVAVSVNDQLWAHPLAAESAARLRSWGVRLLEPVPREGDGFLTMVADDILVAAVLEALG
jgi:phosphopantothenoylcysteine synthetase/decarboxylase